MPVTFETTYVTFKFKKKCYTNVYDQFLMHVYCVSKNIFKSSDIINCNNNSCHEILFDNNYLFPAYKFNYILRFNRNVYNVFLFVLMLSLDNNGCK